MYLLYFIYLFLFPFFSVAYEPAGQSPHDLTIDLFPSRVDFPASPGTSSGGNKFESIQHEIQSPNAGNTAPSDLVEGGNIPLGMQSEPETVLLAGKPKKDAPTPTLFGPPIRQNQNVPEEAYDHTPVSPAFGHSGSVYSRHTNIQTTNKGAVPERKGALLLPLGWPHPFTYRKDYAKCFEFPGKSRITDNPQCIRKQQYCCDSIDIFFNGLSCQAAKPGNKKEQEPAAAAAAYSTPADGPPAPPPVAENPGEKSENVLVAPDAESSQDAIPSASGGNSWDLLNFLPVLTNFWPD